MSDRLTLLAEPVDGTGFVVPEASTPLMPAVFSASELSVEAIRSILEDLGAPHADSDELRRRAAMVITGLANELTVSQAETALTRALLTNTLKENTDLSYRATVDHKTKLNNWLGLEERFAAEERWSIAFLTDLDHFKFLNDRFGHAAGDKILGQVALEVTNCVRDEDIDVVARTGEGDEIMGLIAMPPSGRHQAVTGQIRSIPNRIDRKVNRYFRRLSRDEEYQGSDLDFSLLGISIGVARWQPGMTLQELHDKADAEMYKVKTAHHAAHESPQCTWTPS